MPQDHFQTPNDLPKGFWTAQKFQKNYCEFPPVETHLMAHCHIYVYIYIYIYISELGGPSGKLFRFVSCVRARGAYVRSDLGENLGSASFPFPFSPREVFPFPSALQGPIQLQLALSVAYTLGRGRAYVFSSYSACTEGF